MASRILSLILLTLVTASAMARQDPGVVKQAVEEFLRIQTKGLPGQVSYTVGSIPADNNLAPCGALSVSQAPGNRPWGRGNVTVQCQDAGGWLLYVPIQVRVIADYLVTAKPLAQGQLVAETDLGRRSGDLGDLPAGILTEASQAIGHTAAVSIPAGRLLRRDMLRQPLAVHQNQTVKVVARGAGFEVANEGQALTNGFEGQVVRVRLANGQVLSGIARPGGVIEVGK